MELWCCPWHCSMCCWVCCKPSSTPAGVSCITEHDIMQNIMISSLQCCVLAICCRHAVRCGADLLSLVTS
jgi:hypothetical protein